MKKLLPLLFFLPTLLFAQNEVEKTNESELQELTDYKNTVRWNLTPFVLFGNRNLNFGYERKISDSQTASINIGYLEIPRLTHKGDKIEYVSGESKRGGFSVFADYKFYLSSRNKRKAPEGIYWGPYMGYYNQKLETGFGVYDINNNNTKLADVEMEMQVHNITLGLQLGYQFVFYDRFTLDLVLVGPSYGMYRGDIEGKTKIYDENITENEIYKDFVEMVQERAPWLPPLVNGGEISGSGKRNKFNTFGGNFRYLVQIGYRF